MREALEETGYRVALGERLPTTRYPVRGGRLKRVRYWAAVRISGCFVPGREVDELRWLPVDEARALLSYDHDRELVDAIRKFLPERF
ncbi:NUDIX domain-containing protein [Streptacidiphilus monticola]